MADPTTSPPLTRTSVIEAHELIKPFIHHTPTLTNATLDKLASTPSPGTGTGTGTANPKIRLYFKCENLQRIGAFKIRGAFHAIERLKMDPGWDRGVVVTHSSGNHAQALALAARTNDIPAYIVMPSISSPAKIAATQGYGAKVVFSGSTSVEREAVVERIMRETDGARLVPPYDHPDIILGQGTLGLELQRDASEIINSFSFSGGGGGGGDGGSSPVAENIFRAPETIPKERKEKGKGEKEKKKELDAILAPCGGGGMLSGVALSCEGTGIRVYGCEPSFQGADDAKRGYESQGSLRVETVSTLTIADGLRTPVGRYPWSVIAPPRRLVRGFFSVTEEQIVAALRLILERFKMVVEPSAAVPLAVALFNEDFRTLVEKEGGEDGWDVGVVLSGGNVSLEALGKLFAPKE
ncbi:tryptophan synthase beta subunit-like PLP-dependent enzyme [Poronia punctata]|nr:tryptophan synthase beta subunit-like PLP-dependent enzyme [Poronia punctata]